MKLPVHFSAAFFGLILLTSTHAQTSASCGKPNNPVVPPPGCSSSSSSATENSSIDEIGPEMHVALSSAGQSPGTGQSFVTPNGSSGRSQAIDLTIPKSVGRVPLEFRRYYQSRVQDGAGTLMGHGLTWSHSYSISMTAGGSGVLNVFLPDGTGMSFTSSGTTTFEGSSTTFYKPDSGYGERVYRGQGAASTLYTLVLPSGVRYGFQSITTPEGTLYHPRYHRDTEGRQVTYTTDAKARITGVADAGGNGFTLIYGDIQVNRKASVLLHKVTTNPSTDWNEVTLTTSEPFRWLQAVGSGNYAYFNLAEIEFYRPDPAGPPVKLNGALYGTGPANSASVTATFDKAFDGDPVSGFYNCRPNDGIAGIDLGQGNASHVTKIRFKPRVGRTGSVSMDKLVGTRFEGVKEAPALLEVLQRVESTDGRAVNFIYDTITDPSIGQTHLVLAGVDYDGDGLVTSDTDARFTYVITNQGRAPSVENLYEPRSTGDVPRLKFEYYPAQVATVGTVAKVTDATNGQTILENLPYTKSTLKFPGGRNLVVAYNTSGLINSLTDAEGNATTYTYDGNRFLTSETDPLGRTTTYAFNTRGQRTSITRPNGEIETVVYDASARVVSVTLSAAGYTARTTTWTRDASGRCTRKDFPDGSYETYTYNSLGLVTQKRQRNGSLTTRTIDPSGLVLTLTSASGTPQAETTTYTYYGLADPTGSPARHLKTETDPRGRTTTYQYDSRGQLTRTTYPDGSFRQLTLDPFGNKLSETDGTHTESWTYNGFNKLTTHTDPQGHLTQYLYGDGGTACGCFNAGGPTLIISPQNRMTLREYDLKWRLKKETTGHTSPAAATTEYIYDFVGNPLQKILPDGTTITYAHDAGNRRISERTTGTGVDLTTTHTYSPFGEMLSTTQPGGRTTTMTYNVMKKASSVTDPLGLTTAFTYDLADNRLTTTQNSGGPLAKTTSQTYDLLNRPILTTHPDSTITSTTYHPGGAIASRTDEMSHTTSMDDSLVTWSDSSGNTYTSFVATQTDALGNITTRHPVPTGKFAGTTLLVSPLGRAQESYRNADGTTASTRSGLTIPGSTIAQDISISTHTYDSDHLLLTATTDPGGLNQTTTFTYDARGNKLTSKDPLNRTTSYQYDLRGNITKTTLPDLRANLTTYDALNRVLTTTDPKNQTIAHSYWNETSSMLTLTDSKNQTTTWTYNNRGQLLTKTYPNGDDHAYSYDALGRMATHTTPKNETCTYSYDLRDRQLLADWNTATPDTAKTYFACGLLKSIDNGVSKSDFTYNARHDLTSETQTLTGRPARLVSYQYDADGLRSGTTYPSAKAVALAWTSRFQLQSVSTDGPPPLATYAYDKAGRNTAIAHENGITEAKSYNPAGELLANTHLQGSTPVSGTEYDLDPTGRRTASRSVGVSPTSASYTYDPTNQVVSADYGSSQTDAYAYDPMGNRTTASVASQGGTNTNYTSNSANQYTSITGLTPISHDANGNLLQQNGVTYTWDSENRLLSVNPNTPALGDKSLVHTYDGQHRRVTRTIREWTISGWSNTETIQFIYDGWNVIEEYALGGGGATLHRSLTWGQDCGGAKTLQAAGGVSGLLLVEEISGTTTSAYHFHYDGIGNVTQITDLSGATTASYRYDAFGNTLLAAGTYAAQNRYRFSTKPLDSELASTALYYYGYRYYDPTTGRWPSRDPIEEEGGINLYGFGPNSPLNGYDFLGNGWRDWLDALMTALGTADPGATGTVAGAATGIGAAATVAACTAAKQAADLCAGTADCNDYVELAKIAEKICNACKDGTNAALGGE